MKVPPSLASPFYAAVSILLTKFWHKLDCSRIHDEIICHLYRLKKYELNCGLFNLMKHSKEDALHLKVSRKNKHFTTFSSGTGLVPKLQPTFCASDKTTTFVFCFGCPDFLASSG